MDKTRYRQGELCWSDLGTTDLSGARRFYTELFGWTLVEEQVNGDMTYVRAQIDGKDVCAMYEMPADEAAAAPPHWNVYASVDDIHAAAVKVDALGGLVFAGPFDVMELGRMAMVQDPAGAKLCLWQPWQKFGAERFAEPRAICWFELASTDPGRARDFYAQLFGWTAGGGDDYVEWQLGHSVLGGMLGTGGPSRWTIYFQVVSCDRTLETVAQLGGKTIVPARDMAHVGRYAVVADPAGAMFSVIQPG